MRRNWLLVMLLVVVAACGDDATPPFASTTTTTVAATTTLPPATVASTTTAATTVPPATTPTTASTVPPATTAEPALLASGQATIVADGPWFNVHEGTLGEGGGIGIAGPYLQWTGGLFLMPGSTPPGFAGCSVLGTQVGSDTPVTSLEVGAYLCLHPYPYGVTELLIIEVGTDHLTFDYRTWPTEPTD